MNAVIVGCSSMAKAVFAAQKKMNTDYPTVFIDRKYHADPAAMRDHLSAAIRDLPGSIDAVLTAMGFCGGSWADIDTDKTVVIPRVDDCISLMLHTDDTWHFNLKQATHLYMRDAYGESFGAMREMLRKKYGRQKGDETFAGWFAPFTDLDVIDAGLYDCHNEKFRDKAAAEAAATGCNLNYVRGSNILMEKLVSGRWDHQFIVAPPHHLLSEKDFRSPRG